MTVTGKRSDGNLSPGGAAVTYLEPALWKRLAETEHDEEFCQVWLRLQCRMISGVVCGIVMLDSPQEDKYVPAASWPEGFRFHQQFAEVIDKALIEQKGVVLRPADTSMVEAPDQQTTKPAAERGQEANLHIGYPIVIGRRISSLVAIEVTPRSTSDLQTAMRQLQWGSAWLKNKLQQSQSKPDTVIRERLMTVFDIISLSLQETRFKPAATKLVTELATHLSCDRASAGFVRGRQTKILALSHSAKFDGQSNLMRSIGNAMDECIDQGEMLIYPDPGDMGEVILNAHTELARLHGAGAICTVPFLDKKDQAYGALTMERPVGQPFDAESATLCEAVAALAGPTLEEKRRNDRNVFIKIGASIANVLGLIFGRGHLALKLFLLILVCLTAFFSYYDSDYRVTAITTLEGKIQRAIICPFDGYLEATQARAGDIVEQNEVLAALNTRDLALEQIKLQAEREQRLLEYNKALAANDIAQSTIILEQVKQSEAQIDLLQQHIERALIRAPFRGILISGDLDHSIGAPIKRGEVLYEIAPLDSYRVIVEIDERDIEQVSVAHQGNLVLNSLPEMNFPFVIDKITPVSTTNEGRNYFVAEARLLESSSRLRPGMQGYGKIFIEHRKLIWIWTHGLTDWFRLWAWSWIP